MFSLRHLATDFLSPNLHGVRKHMPDKGRRGTQKVCFAVFCEFNIVLVLWWHGGWSSGFLVYQRSYMIVEESLVSYEDFSIMILFLGLG